MAAARLSPIIHRAFPSLFEQRSKSIRLFPPLSKLSLLMCVVRELIDCLRALHILKYATSKKTKNQKVNMNARVSQLSADSLRLGFF